MINSDDFSVQVETTFLDHQTVSSEEKYAFSYQINIRNEGNESVQLLSRYWLITDANGQKIEVHGEGVVGQQPLINNGHQFSYSSGAVIDTPVGTMQGYYEMQRIDGSLFQLPISVFSLADQRIIN